MSKRFILLAFNTLCLPSCTLIPLLLQCCSESFALYLMVIFLFNVYPPQKYMLVFDLVLLIMSYLVDSQDMLFT